MKQSRRVWNSVCLLVFIATFWLGFRFDSNVHAQSEFLLRPSSSQPRPVSMNESNPFYAPSKLPLLAPDFSAIETSHFVPAFEAGIQQQLEEVQAIASQSAPATFENTMIPFEKSGEILDRVTAVFFNLAGAHTNPTIQEIEARSLPNWQPIR